MRFTSAIACCGSSFSARPVVPWLAVSFPVSGSMSSLDIAISDPRQPAARHCLRAVEAGAGAGVLQ